MKDKSEIYKPMPNDKSLARVPDECVTRTRPRFVVCAANLCADGTILCGPRHWDSVMRRQADAIGWDDRRTAEQGFIDQWGNFMTREEARFVAVKNGQVSEDDLLDENELYSEDLY
jgi:hypothetical protein